MKKSVTLLAAATTLMLASISTESYASDPVATVRSQLSRARGQLQGRGYRETHDAEIDSLREGRQKSYNIRLREGMDYAIVGVCDGDCSDLDLVLYDENGNEVDRDSSRDDLPVITISPRWTGQFSLKVQMADCSSEPCAYGMVVMGK